MGASLTTLDLATEVAAGSSLSRRRAAAYPLVVRGRYKSYRGPLIVLLALIGFAAYGSIEPMLGEAREARNRALSLIAPTAASNIDRFFIIHRVKHGDTIWQLALHYYGSSTLVNQRRLIEANPGLPKDLRLLTVDTPIKVPLI
jgi:phage tail protein X